jgi:hypothetical protein
VWLRVHGPTADALARAALPVEPCRPDAAAIAALPAGTPTPIDATTTGIPMSAGEHLVRTGVGRLVGINVDRLALASDRVGPCSRSPTSPSQVP